jgi:hypothetical protein
MQSTANDLQRLTRPLCNSSPIGAATFAAPHSVGVEHEKFARFSHKNPLQICRVSPYGSTRVVDPSFMAQRYMQRHYTESAICVEP